MTGTFRLNLCKKEFWDGFCSVRNRGVHLVLVLVLLNAVYACVLLLMSAYFGNFSDVQHAGYLTLIVANVISIVAGFLSIHFLTLKPSNSKLSSYCISLHVAYIVAIIFGALTIVLMIIPPSLNQIRDYSKSYVFIYHKTPFMIRALSQEKHCCGIKQFGDFFKVTKQINESEITPTNPHPPPRTYFRIPPSCCRKDKFEANTCNNFTDILVRREDLLQVTKEFLYPDPCFKKGETFDTVLLTGTFSVYMYTVYATVGVFFFIFGILAILNYYVWYRFRRRPPGERPDHFIEDMESFMRCRCHKLKTSIEENKRRESLDREAMMEGKKDVNDFAARHQMILKSLQLMREQNQEKRAREQRERQINMATSGSSHQMLLGVPSSMRPIGPLSQMSIRHLNHEKHEKQDKHEK